ncbi:4Fe-4S dicluster domain-containing protein [Symbiobacterium terraclitae]|uniref:4Fe-4S dicluster domain-containing protein n=1 Tax=Symbiobacterium terraclitae TaxID=557451 RepID=UPI0035B5335D
MAAARPPSSRNTDEEIRPCHLCLRCVEACPTSALAYERPRWRLDLSLCMGCRDCTAVCPNPLIQSS